MRKKICIVTATRAEYGLLKPLIVKLNKMREVETKLVVTGAHLSSEFGSTYKEIEKDDITIDKKIDILLSSDTPSAISKSMALAIMGFADYFEETNPDLLILLGDRYEVLAISCAAMNQRIPIAHLYGGEKTEGAVDESIRHSVTKLSYLHFTSTEQYKNRVIQLGEDPERVFNVGALGVQNIMEEKLLPKSVLYKTLNINLNTKLVVGTFHPVTLENNSSEIQIRNLLDACVEKKELTFLFTKANADANGRIINKVLAQYSKKFSNILLFDSLSVNVYLSALKYSEFFIGNSSSGILEAPSFKIPTINIGDRQLGRLQANSVVNCGTNKEEILKSINYVLTDNFRKKLKDTINPYGDGNTVDKIISKISEFLNEDKINLKKKFYDLK